jgi:uncharacterized delta-60 repeat protein
MLFRLFRKPRRKAPARPVRFRPRLEALEDRYCPAGGLLDPTFGTGGIVNLPSATDNGATAVAVQPDGKVVVAGAVNRRASASSFSSGDSISVQRLNRDGTLDTTFYGTGSVAIKASGNDLPNALALQPDGRILVGGWATDGKDGNYQFLVARLNANGTLDTTFGSKGLWLSASLYGSMVKKLTVLTDPAHPTTVTGIVASARGIVNGTNCFEAIKLTPAGAPDRTFGSGGFAVFAGLNGGDAESVAADRLTGEIYLAGSVRLTLADGSQVIEGCLAALTPAGALDPAFGGGAGYVLAAPTGFTGSDFHDVAVQTLTVNGQPVSRLVVAGDAYAPNVNGYAVVAGFTLDGTLDTSFGSGGWFLTAGPSNGYSPSFHSLALEADGSIVVGGFVHYTAADGTNHSEMLVGHLTAAGAADTSFGPDGTGLTVVQDGLDSRVWSVAVDPINGGILASGYSISSSGAAQQAAVARFTAP